MKQVIFTIGRCNPPTKGHKELFDFADTMAKSNNCEYRTFVTRSHDPKTNPLSVEDKLYYLRIMFPQYTITDTLNAFTACRELALVGFEKAILVVGEDRQDLISGLRKYIDHADPLKSIGLKEIDVVVTPRHFSATKARSLVLKGSFEEFCSLIPSVDTKTLISLFNALRTGMGVGDAII